MSQIEITVLKAANPPRKKVLSCSFFTMQGAYRDVSVYLKNLTSFIKNKVNLLKDFEIRVYTDDSGKDNVLSIAGDDPRVSVYHYNCEPFREGNGHTGTFGTLVRFLPLFEQGLDIVWISDIDISAYMLNPDILTKMKSLKRVFHYNTFVCYDRKPWTSNVKFPIVAVKIISFITFPRQILTRFISKLINGDYKDVISIVNEYNDRKTPNKKFPYGMDEYFINTVLYNYIKNHDISVYLIKGYAVGSILKYKSKVITDSERKLIDDFIYTPNKEDFVKIKKLYKKLIPPLLEELPCLQEVLDNIDSLPAPTKIGWLIEQPVPNIKTLS